MGAETEVALDEVLDERGLCGVLDESAHLSLQSLHSSFILGAHASVRNLRLHVKPVIAASKNLNIQCCSALSFFGHPVKG